MLIRQVKNIGKLLLHKVRSSPMWESRRDSYLKRAPVEAADGGSLLEEHWKVIRLSTAIAPTETEAAEKLMDDKLASYRTFAANCAHWQKVFRKGCTLEMHAALLMMLSHDVSVLVGGDSPANLPVACLLRDALALISLPKAAEVRTRFMDVISQWQSEAQVNQLSAAADDYAKLPCVSTCIALESALAAAAGVEGAGTILSHALRVSVRSVSQNIASDYWRAVSKLWGTVGSASLGGGEELQNLVETCAGFDTLMKPFVRLGTALDAYQDASKDVSVEPAALEAKLLPALQAMAAALGEAKTTTEGLADIDEENAPKEELDAWVACRAALKEVCEQWQDEAKTSVVHMAALLTQKLSRATHYLAQVAGGASHGKAWYESFDGNVNSGRGLLEHFESTLEVADTKRISTLLRGCEEADSGCSPTSCFAPGESGGSTR